MSRVLQLLGPSTGGIRRHVAYLGERLQTAGWEVHTAGPAGVLEGLDHVVPIPVRGQFKGLVPARRVLRPLLGSHDIVHAHGLKAGWLASLVSPRPPLVISVHNLVLDEVAGRSAAVQRRLEGRLPSRADATIAVSAEVARRFDGLPGAERIHVIPPAGPPPEPSRSRAEVRAELGIDPDDDLVVTAARLTPQKGLHVLIDAAEAARYRRPRLRWFVFGDGALRDELQSEIVRRGLSDTVRLAGARPSVDDELAAADVVAVTSLWESGPLVVLEALSLGRPVVSTRVGLAPDVIDPSRGRIVDVGASAAMADAVVELLEADPPDDTDPPEDTDPPGDTGRMQGSSAGFQPPYLASAVEAVYREVLHTR